MSRPDQRHQNQLRPLSCDWEVAPNALSSLLIKCGNTQVICAVSCEEKIPRWKEIQKLSGGWITAEYSMFPYSTSQRKPRDISRGKLDGRSQEIQRLIGRSLRAVADLEALGPRTLWIDCDVLAADGGTRTTAITGACLALRLAVERLMSQGVLDQSPLLQGVAATSVGLVDEQARLDLCYLEDRDASVDMNVVMTETGEFVEIGASGEESTFSRKQLDELMELADSGIQKLFAFQKTCWKKRPKTA